MAETRCGVEKQKPNSTVNGLCFPPPDPLQCQSSRAEGHSRNINYLTMSQKMHRFSTRHNQISDDLCM